MPPVAHPSGAQPPQLPAHLLPRHVAVIMDGNGRWAMARNQPRTAGHEAGQLALRDVVYGGEQRTSNFLPRQSTYAELVLLDALWPDIDRTHLWQVIDAYPRRDRRFGGTQTSLAAPPRQ
ncbi:undecaprenyl diphosphate synthase family protein [Streptomyces sp. NPDC058335]|uniref:undecaprenyl diphosphate synthase family protein n=1 Tax=Streptomyces sp. NPDC058335 TaxID=3346451 RepID=UPI00364ED76C